MTLRPRPQKPLGMVNEALQQIAYADRLVLNKTDLATPAELDDLETRLRDINSLAQARACFPVCHFYAASRTAQVVIRRCTGR